jgi:hypothetical protein
VGYIRKKRGREKFGLSLRKEIGPKHTRERFWLERRIWVMLREKRDP